VPFSPEISEKNCKRSIPTTDERRFSVAKAHHNKELSCFAASFDNMQTNGFTGD